MEHIKNEEENVLLEKQDIFSIIQFQIIQILPEVSSHHFAEKDLIRDIVADSIDRAAILTRTIEQLSLKVPLVTFFGPKDFKTLIDLIYKLKHQS
jgi:polyketide biosynthesis acyl carrier protein